MGRTPVALAQTFREKAGRTLKRLRGPTGLVLGRVVRIHNAVLDFGDAIWCSTGTKAYMERVWTRVRIPASPPKEAAL